MSLMFNVLVSRNLSFVTSVCIKKVVLTLSAFKFSRANPDYRATLHGNGSKRLFGTSRYSSIGEKMNDGAMPNEVQSKGEKMNDGAMPNEVQSKGEKMNDGAVPNEGQSNKAVGEDCAVPNEEWSKEAVDLFKTLSEMTGDWRKSYGNNSKAADGSRSFIWAVTGESGKFFETAIFNNPTLQCSKAVVQFGPYTRGPIGHVHGGAIATILDIAMGNLIYTCGINSVTGNLNVVYLRPIPLDTTTLVEAKIDKIDGRKIFASAAIKTVDGCDVYSRATSIFIMLTKSWKSSL